MSYRIIGDSCTDLTPELKSDPHFFLVPLTIHMGGIDIVDDDTFDQKDFLTKIAAFAESPKSSCPSPEAYMKLFEGDDDIYIVTLSSNLSGSYNSAVLAKKLYLEEHKDRNIEIIDSRSASVAQTLIAMKIKELVEMGNNFAQIVELVTEFRKSMNTKFVLESLENLRKNGRLSNMQAIIISVLNIKLIMEGNKEGNIAKLDQARGINRALKKMTEMISKDAIDSKNRIVAIAHCNNYERALFVKEQILKRIEFKEVLITDTAGISSLYANNGGIIVSY
jgi:DegV family protein with EDD domain